MKRLAAALLVTATLSISPAHAGVLGAIIKAPFRLVVYPVIGLSVGVGLAVGHTVLECVK